MDNESAENTREAAEELHPALPVDIMNGEIQEAFPYYAFPAGFPVGRYGNPVGVAYIGDAAAEKFGEWILYSTDGQSGAIQNRPSCHGAKPVFCLCIQRVRYMRYN